MTKIKVKKNIIQIGCDPELMLKDKAGSFIAAPTVLTGTKRNPTAVKGGAVHADNVALEFNTKPARNAKEFIKSIDVVLNESHRLIGDGNTLIVQASANFPANALTHPDTQEFGCEPDFDAWRKAINTIDDTATAKPFRSAGGHVHIGMTDASKKLLSDPYGKLKVIKVMDLFAGVISIILDTDPSSKERRTLYGKAGSHRPKPYGVEYRALGNFWVKSPQLVELIHDLTCFAVQVCLNEMDEELISAVGEKMIQKAINESNIEMAKHIFASTLSRVLPDDILTVIKNLEGKEFDFYQEWNLS